MRISTFLWLVGKAGVCHSLSLVDAGIFGSLISATAPTPQVDVDAPRDQLGRPAVERLVEPLFLGFP